MKTIKFISMWILIILLSSSEIFASSSISGTNPVKRNFTTIKGKTVDSKTQKPLVYVAVCAVGTNIATVTNSDGDFTLKLDDSLKVTKIQFIHTGYKTVIKDVSEFVGQTPVVKLESDALILDEVTVRPNDAYFIVEQMLDKVGENYSRTPNSMMAFYRETVKQKKRYVSISEAVIDVYKASYVNDFHEDMTRLYKGRKSSDVKKQDTILFKLQGGPDGILLMDVAKNPYVLFADGKIALYNFEIEEAVNIDSRANYVISFSQKKYLEMPLYFGKLYIDMKTNALTSAEFSLNIEDKYKAAQLFIRKKPLGMSLTPETTSYIVKYKQQGDKFYFNYARNEVTFKLDWKRRLFKSYYTIMSEIAVTDREDKVTSDFPRQERLKSNVVMQDKISPFADNDFWGEYNTIQPDESIEAAIKKYGKRLNRNNN
jgi:hypothetical protein